MPKPKRAPAVTKAWGRRYKRELEAGGWDEGVETYFRAHRRDAKARLSGQCRSSSAFRGLSAVAAA